MPATFNDLPLPLHSQILTYVSTPPHYPLIDRSFQLRPGQHKQSFYAQVKPYEALNHAWRDLIQAKLWNCMLLPPLEIKQLRKFFILNPALATYLHTLKLKPRICQSSELPVPTNANPSIPFDETAGDTKVGLGIAQIWSEVLDLIQTYLARYGRFEKLMFGVRLDTGEGGQVVEFPRGYTLRGGGQGLIRALELSARVSECGKVLGMDSVRKMINSVGGGLEQLELVASDWGVGERTVRRKVYVGITHLTTSLKPLLAPNLTTLRLIYSAFTPCNRSETRIYSYTHLDNNIDLLSRALRILSKQLTSFTYLGGRISSELFLPSTPTEDTVWPYLKYYNVHFSSIAADGTWLFLFSDPSSTYTPDDPPPRTPPTPPSEEMSATDITYVDPVDHGDYDPPPRYFPVRAVINELFESASRAMVPGMPAVEHWELRADGVGGRGAGMGIIFDYEEGTGRPRVTRGRAYEHSRGAMRVWEERFEGLLLVKDENAGMCGVGCMDEEDQRMWRDETSGH